MLMISQPCIRRYLQNCTANSLRSRALNHFATRRRNGADRYKSPLTEDDDDGASHQVKSGYAENRQKWLQSRGQTPAHKLKQRQAPGPNDAAMKKHLLYLQDPLKLAKDVRLTLQRGRFGDAQDVVRAASKTVQCTVSWNHLIDWQMSQGKVKGALQTYNEMKKRAQVPDSHTYAILFRGLAAFTQYPNALEQALSIYHSMLPEEAPVKPNTAHTNSMLKVCSRAGNMDALFGVAAKLPQTGFGAADSHTFTTIINAIRQHAVSDTTSRLTEEEWQAQRRKAVLQGRRMWDDIIGRWRKGDIFIDEELVCSMGRLLLIGNDSKDWDDVFSLLQQTMNIPRPFEKLGTPKRDRHEPSLQSRTAKSTPETDTTDLKPIETPELENDIESEAQFQVVKPPLPESNDIGGYVRPGTNALSVALEAVTKSSVKRSWKHYWDAFTLTHQIKPDAANCAQVLRILRKSRSSCDTVKLLQTMEKMDRSYLQAKMFRIALSACERDKNNPHAFANAGKALDLMQQTLEEPDIKALASYLDVAMAYRPPKPQSTLQKQSPKFAPLQNLPPSSTAQANEVKFAAGRQILRALFRLQPSVINIRSYLTYGSHTRQDEDTLKAQELAEALPSREYVESAMELFTRMVSAYDKLMYAGMVARSKYSELQEERKILGALVERTRKKYLGDEKLRGGVVPRADKKYVRRPESGSSNYGVRTFVHDSDKKERRPDNTRKPQIKEEEPQIDYSAQEAAEAAEAAEKIRREMGFE